MNYCVNFWSKQIIARLKPVPPVGWNDEKRSAINLQLPVKFMGVLFSFVFSFVEGCFFSKQRFFYAVPADSLGHSGFIEAMGCSKRVKHPGRELTT